MGQTEAHDGWHLSNEALALYRRAVHGHSIQGTEAGADELITRGLLIHEPWNNRYTPTDLAAFQRRMHAEQRTRIANLLHEQTNAEKFFQQMEKMADERTPGVRFAGEGDAQAELQSAAENVSKSIRAAHPLPRTQRTVDVSLNHDIPRLKNGVSFRTIYQDSARSRTPEQTYARGVSEHGGEVRTLAGDFIRTVIVDDAIAIVSDYRTLPPNSNAGWIVTHPGMLAFVIQAFEFEWSIAAPWMGDRTRIAEGSTITTLRSRKILRSLDVGHTHQAIATALGLNRSTVNAEISTLYEKTGTSSLFELGGWWARSEEQRLP
ncbi:hypothetical protein AB0J38_41255 [Streptomyces sp. NPDC050095]|uniref:hypothetical protein n=1 Tax=unclassified Streptomyces TaxID=2593676 RepID=UPI003447AC23